MQMELSAATAPPIVFIDSEADALANLALLSLNRSALAAELLLQEIDRATTMDHLEIPADVVTMKSRVVFVDKATGETHSLELAYPKDANLELGRLSVLTPIGAALIGMAVGNSIDWPNRRGDYRRLEIIAVVQPARHP